ncbi:MAG: hemerythrin domain-containing protein [Candidatus Bipolaricaulia bacterium]
MEIFSDELKAICPNCGRPVYREAMPSCLDWCPAARECIGPERWEQLEREKEELSGMRAEEEATRPTEILLHEHRLIERLLRVLESIAERLEGGEEISLSVFKQTLEFIRTFADRCHHGKEEDALFPLLEERGVLREGGPIGMMLQEHEQGREFVRGLAAGVAKYEGGDTGAKGEIVENARGYIQLLRRHIQKEEDVLFPIADHLLSPGEQQKLLESFAEAEEEIGEGAHERLEGLIGELEGSLA